MDSSLLKQLLRQPESAKLDFKAKLHDIYHVDRVVQEAQWHELLKDVIALSNGNVGTSTETGYLICGASDKLNQSGVRDLYDVGVVRLSRRQLLDRVNSACFPPLPDVLCDTVDIDGTALFVIALPPSPYIHRTTQVLKTPKASYPANAFLFRRKDGEYTYNAAPEEQQIVQQEKSAAIPGNRPSRADDERRWEYLQEHEIGSIEIFLILKDTAGLTWLNSILDSTTVRLGSHASSLGSLISSAPTQRTDAASPDKRPSRVHYWQIYEHQPGYWCKRLVNGVQAVPETVAGLDAVLPWQVLSPQGAGTLGQISRLREVGVSFPIGVFQVGIEECEIAFRGDTFSFHLSLSDHGLDHLHELARMQHVAAPKDHLPIGVSFSGMQLLEIFHAQATRARAPSKDRPFKYRGISGTTGPEGREISFFPDMPKGFLDGPEGKLYLFTVQVTEKDFSKRITELEAAVGAASNDPEAYLELSFLYSQEGRLTNAIRTLKQGVSVLPPNQEVHRILGSMLVNLSRVSEAIVHLEKAVSLDPRCAKARMALATALGKMNKYDIAARHLKRAARLAPDDANIHRSLGIALMILGQLDAAITPLRRAAELAPDDVFVLKLVGGLLDERRKGRDATAYLKRATEIHPPDPEAFLYLGQHYHRAGNVEAAEESLRRSIAINESDSRPFGVLGAILANVGRWQEAKLLLERALDLAPNDAAIIANLGAVSAELGETDAGIVHLRRAIELNPNNEAAQLNLARALRKLKQVE